MNIKQENLDLSFGQNYDVPLMTLILDELKARYKVIEKKQLNGIDQSYWDLKINGFSFCLHYEHYLGVSLYYRSWFKREQARKMLNEIAGWASTEFSKIETS